RVVRVVCERRVELWLGSRDETAPACVGLGQSDSELVPSGHNSATPADIPADQMGAGSFRWRLLKLSAADVSPYGTRCALHEDGAQGEPNRQQQSWMAVRSVNLSQECQLPRMYFLQPLPLYRRSPRSRSSNSWFKSICTA